MRRRLGPHRLFCGGLLTALVVACAAPEGLTRDGDDAAAASSSESPSSGTSSSGTPRGTGSPTSGGGNEGGQTTVPAPVNIPEFNDIQGLSWTEAEPRVLNDVAEGCGDFGPECVKVTTAVTPDPIPSQTDCAVRGYGPQEGLHTGDTITVVINDECDGVATAPIPLTVPNFDDLVGRSWTEVEEQVSSRVARACQAASFGPDCVDVETSVESDGATPDTPDCAVLAVRTAGQLLSGDDDATAERDDLVVAVLRDACGTG